jgi:hypothetical protein
VYYLSEVLTLSKQNYPHYQKVTYNVYMVARKLKHYFKKHPITVVSTTPLSEIIRCKDATSRVAKGAIERATHTILYKPRTMIKSQILADFFDEWGDRGSRCCKGHKSLLVAAAQWAAALAGH